MFEKKLPALLARGEIGTEALYATVDALGKPASAARLHELVARFDQILRETPRGWAKTAEALVAVNDFNVVASWVADWRTREVTEPWMLYPAALCFRTLDRVNEAYEVSFKALTLPNQDPTVADHQVWVALEDALNGRGKEAGYLLEEIEVDDLDDLPRLFHVLAETLVAVQQATTSEARTAAFVDAKKKAEEALARYAPKESNGDLSRTYRRWTQRLSADAGSLAAWAWGLWRKFRRSI